MLAAARVHETLIVGETKSERWIVSLCQTNSSVFHLENVVSNYCIGHYYGMALKSVRNAGPVFIQVIGDLSINLWFKLQNYSCWNTCDKFVALIAYFSSTWNCTLIGTLFSNAHFIIPSALSAGGLHSLSCRPLFTKGNSKKTWRHANCKICVASLQFDLLKEKNLSPCIMPKH